MQEIQNSGNTSTIKRIQSRVLSQELTAEEIDSISGAGCAPTAKLKTDSKGKKYPVVDVSCSL